MSSRTIIYRSCDRPKYMEKTLPLLVERTSDEADILVFDNSRDADSKQRVQAVCDDLDDDRIRLHLHNRFHIGGTAVIIESLKMIEADHAMVVDDDVVVPPPLDNGDTWDEILAEMLDAGWNVVAHPWAQSFRDGASEIRDYGGVKGYIYSAVGGGCSAFLRSFAEENPMKQQTLIRGYNEWMVENTKMERCGYSYRGDMVIEHIDRPDHPWSLRDTEYDEWSTKMYWERFPELRGQARPKGPKGAW